MIRPVFRAETGEEARQRLGEAVAQLERPLPKVAAMLEEAEEDILAFYAFPAEHWPKLRSTNPLERFNREIGRRTDVVGIFPDDALTDPAGLDARDRSQRRMARRPGLHQPAVDGAAPRRSGSIDPDTEEVLELQRGLRRQPQHRREERQPLTPLPGPRDQAQLGSLGMMEALIAVLILPTVRIPFGDKRVSAGAAADICRLRRPPAGLSSAHECRF